MIAALLLLAAATKMYARALRLPLAVALVLTGIVVAQLARIGPEFLRPLARLEVPPDLIFLVFLPTLVFEAAFRFDPRQLRRNLAPILTLAVPGLLLTTTLIGTLVWLLTPIEFPAALLLGAMLGATDPAAVMALFRQVGAPKRLVVLLEGESLFNDATAIVLSRILVAVVVAGYVTTEAALDGISDFLVIFLGAVVVGWLAGRAMGYVLGRVEDDPLTETTLTTVLAYGSFLVAEELFHVSGVMAAMVAGITMAGWGRTKISPELAEYLEKFWEYLSFVAVAMIFLLVGLRIDLGALVGAADVLLWVVLAMIVARATTLFVLLPLVGKLPGSEPIGWRYKTVMSWGGVPGEVALAIVLSLPAFQYHDLFIALITGAVLATLLLQGITLERLVRWLGLDQPPLADRFARAEGVVSAKRHSLDRLPELQAGGLFSARIADLLRARLGRGIEQGRSELELLRREELDAEQERRLLFLRSFAAEKTCYYEMFAHGHLSERAYRDLAHSIEVQSDAMRHHGVLPQHTLHPPSGAQLESIFVRVLDRLLGLTPLPERMRAARTARDYEEAWGRHQGSTRILENAERLARAEHARPELVAELRAFYQRWNEAARERLDMTAELFPEFVSAMQERLAERLVLHAERETIEQEARAGRIPTGVAEPILEELTAEIRQLRGQAVGELRVDPSELLRKVPFFDGLPATDFARVSERLQQRTVPAGEIIIRQGESGDSLFLIARGVVRVSRADRGGDRDLATLLAGDFFGEMALLHGERRTATCRAVTPCVLYELRRTDFDEVRIVCPTIQEALEKAEKERRAQFV